MRVRRLRKQHAALEVSAFINLIVVLVPFLLSTAVFTRLSVIDLSLYELLKAYGDQHRRKATSVLHIEPFDIYTVEDALERLRKLLGTTPDWQNLWHFLPEGLKGGLILRSALASTFTATLEMAREGKVRIKQSTTFGPIFLRAVEAQAPTPSNSEHAAQ